jgi:hypothetical protein
MPINSPTLGSGTTLQLHDGTSTYATVAYAIELQGPNQENPLVDITHLASTAREYIAGLTDGGEVTITGHLTEDATVNDTSGLEYVFTQKLTRLFQITPANATKRIRFSAIITRFNFTGFTADDTMKFEATLKITGAVTRPNVA